MLTGSSQLAEKFDNENLMSLYLVYVIITLNLILSLIYRSLLIFSSISRTINSKILIKFSYHCRVIFFSVYASVALIIMYFILKASKDGDLDNTVGFWLSLIPSIMIGTACSMGESTLIGKPK